MWFKHARFHWLNHFPLNFVIFCFYQYTNLYAQIKNANANKWMEVQLLIGWNHRWPCPPPRHTMETKFRCSTLNISSPLRGIFCEFSSLNWRVWVFTGSVAGLQVVSAWCSKGSSSAHSSFNRSFKRERVFSWLLFAAHLMMKCLRQS